MKDDIQNNELETVLQKFAETIIRRDEKREDRLTTEVANLAKEMSNLVSIVAVSEQKHEQARIDRDKTDETLKDHGKRLYAVEAQTLLLTNNEKTTAKRWERIDMIKASVITTVIAAAILIYLGLK